MTNLTKTERLVLQDYIAVDRANAYQLGVDPRVVMSLCRKGMIRPGNLLGKPSQTVMEVTAKGISTFYMDETNT